MFTYKLDVLRDGKFSFSPLLGIVRVFLRGPSIDQLNCPSIVWLVNISECKLNFLRKLKFSSDPPLLGIVEIFLLGTSINQLTRAQVLYNWLIDFWIPDPNKKKIFVDSLKLFFLTKWFGKLFCLLYFYGRRLLVLFTVRLPARLSVPLPVANFFWNF
jgi:hypothetical protein